MSYSRWITSRWYTYWTSILEEENYDTATFCICRFEKSLYFTAKEIREDIGKCISEVKKEETNATDEELEELKNYMIEFLIDVETEYKN